MSGGRRNVEDDLRHQLGRDAVIGEKQLRHGSMTSVDAVLDYLVDRAFKRRTGCSTRGTCSASRTPKHARSYSGPRAERPSLYHRSRPGRSRRRMRAGTTADKARSPGRDHPGLAPRLLRRERSTR
jgi:hypothetical protein